mmetsp:Transcript_36390/g.88141  ORF Transcript_36390/g.88141 Transcript_36390/m.88141 type:complete len:175 (+) Transcript_36390:124-648(+)
MSPPADRNGTNESTEQTKEVVEEKTEEGTEEIKHDVTAFEENSKSKDQGSSALGKAKDAGSSETNTFEGQEKTPIAAPILKNSQAQPQNEPVMDSKGYRDCAEMEDPVPLGKSGHGVLIFFPVKLHKVLRQVEFEGRSHIISFCPHGRAFVIHKPKRYEKEIMTRFFRQSRYHT